MLEKTEKKNDRGADEMQPTTCLIRVLGDVEWIELVKGIEGLRGGSGGGLEKASQNKAHDVAHQNHQHDGLVDATLALLFLDLGHPGSDAVDLTVICGMLVCNKNAAVELRSFE